METTMGRDRTALAFMWFVLFLMIPLFFLIPDFILIIKLLTLLSVLYVFIGFIDIQFGLIGIGLLAILDPFTRTFLATGGSYLFRWNINNYILLGSAVLLLITRNIKIKDITSKFLFFLILLCVLQLIYSSNINSGIYYILNLFSYFGFLIIFILGSSKRQKLLNELLVIAVICLFINIAYRVRADTLPYIDHNSLAQAGLSGLFALCIGLSIDNNDSLNLKISIIVALLSSTLFVMIYLTGSRSVTLLAILALFYILMKLGKYSLSKSVFAILLSSITIIFLVSQFFNAVDNAQTRIDKLLNIDLPLAERTSQRSDLLIIGWKLFIDHPLGIGTGSLDKGIIRAYSVNKDLNSYGLVSVHSGLMKTLDENGFLGGIFLLLFVVSFVYTNIKQRGNNPAMEIGLLCSAVLFFSLFFTEFQGKSLMFLASGSAYVVYYKYRNPLQEKTND